MPQLLKFLRYFLLGRAQRIFGAQALTALVLLGFGASVWTTLRTEICEQEIYIVKENDFRVWNPPAWVSDRFVAEVLELRAPEARGETLNSLDPNLIDNLLIAFESHPWVERVESIETRFPARIDVKLRFKEPVAVVDPTPAVAVDWSDPEPFEFQNGGENGPNAQTGEIGQSAQGLSETGAVFEKYVVDDKGYRLPDEYFRKNPSVYRRFPIILGIRSTPVSGAGQCGDPAVVEAAAFARFLTDSDALEKLGVDRVIVAKRRGETNSIYCLKTTGNATVYWGTFATANANGEKTVEKETQRKKLERLFAVAEKYASLENVPPEARAELDVSGWANGANSASK